MTDLSSTASLLALRHTLAAAEAAADAWSAFDLGQHAESLAQAASGIARARAMLRDLQGTLPSHARRVRLLGRAIDRTEAVLAAVAALPAAPVDLTLVGPDDEAAQAEEQALWAVARATSAAERALAAVPAVDCAPHVAAEA